jgi:phosphoribosylformimino-5-aminoimidazole carboxamide ribotide isomerase
VTSGAFTLLPAIDLRGGRVVRLEQGDFARETAFGDDPAAQAAAFVTAGAQWLHVVDLDGARAGEPRQPAAVAAIAEAVGRSANVEVAGGLRTADAIASILDAGAARAVIGTVAVEEPETAGELVVRFGAARVAVAVDVRDGLAVGRAWQAGAAGVPARDLVTRLVESGVRTFEVTAVARDGLMTGPDLGLLGSLTGIDGADVIASGGVRGAADIRAVRSIGCVGAIVGRALYDGSLSIEAALAAAAEPAPAP